jgi:hypothetical protein
MAVDLGHGESRARALDDLAEEILAGLAPLTFRRAATAEEVDAAHKLRFAAVVENGWAPAEAFPDGRERDEDDAGAVHVVCLDAGEVVGAMRLVPPRPGRPLPVERDFGVRVEPPGSAVDAGRVVVAPSHRGGRSQIVMTGLAARGWLEARALGAGRVVGAGSDRAIALYESLGMVVERLGPPRPYWGEDRSPIELSGAEDAIAVVRGDLPAEPMDRAEPAVTRRGLLARAGGVAGGLVVVGLADAAAAAPAPGSVGAGPSDRRTIDFLARADQNGRDLVARGFLTRVQGLGVADLSTAPPGTSSGQPAAADVSTRRFTVVVRARIEAISILGSAITGSGVGTAEIHFLPSGGASFDAPDSFAGGTTVAGFTLRFQHGLALDEPNKAAATFGADLSQRSARVFRLGGRRLQLGRPGLPWSLRAGGRGERLEPTTPVSQHFLSGDLGVVDAVRRS